MMQSESYCQENTNSKGVSYKQRNSEVTEDFKHHPFNHIDRLVADHNVTVSNTMIKVTYNKGIRNHSITTANGNEFSNKRHTVAFDPSYTDTKNGKPSIVSKNHNKSFNNIVFIPKNVALTKSNGVAVVKNNFHKEYKGLINEGKLYITPEKKYFKEDIQKIKNNSCSYSKGHQLKELRIHLIKMNTSMTQSSSKSPAPVIHMVENHSNHSNSTNEVNSKIFMNENKDPGSSSVGKIVIKKEKVKLSDSSNSDKERLKLTKDKDENFKKKRPAPSVENQGKTKKLKTNLNISGKETKEKGNTSKFKQKKMSVNLKEKKMPVKALNSTQMSKNGSKRELLRDDPSLPPGWRRIIKGRFSGEEFKPVICIASPEGRKFYFKAKLQEYLKKTNSNLTIDDFHFGLYKKGIKDKYSKEQNKKVNSDVKNIVKNSKKKKVENTTVQHDTKKIHSHKTNNVKNRVKDNLSFKHKVGKAGNNDTGTLDKNVLLVDPDLPPGWIRKVRIKKGVEGSDKFQVCLISPEGKRFKKMSLLQKHLIKTGSPLNIDQFYFGLCPRKDGSGDSNALDKSSTGKSKTRNDKLDLSQCRERDNEKFVSVQGKEYRLVELESSEEDSVSDVNRARQMSLVLTKVDGGINVDGKQPMLEDPTLPPGWRRYVKVRSSGESAGKMVAIIVSPDGRKHRSKGRLKNYITENGLNLNADDFDFTVFGRNSKKDLPEASTPSPAKSKSNGQIVRKRESLLLPSSTSYSNCHATGFDMTKLSREALMIHYVSGIMLNCGLRDLRSERRQRIPKEEQEKLLKKFLESDGVENVNEENEISTNWIQKLVQCRSDFGTLEQDALSTIASLTKQFLLEFTRHALEVSKEENTLKYGDLAEVVDKSEALSPLKTLIPKKITFKEFIRLNRPKKFSSFT